MKGPLPLRRLRGLRVQLLLWTIFPLAIALTVLSLAGVFRHRQAMQQLVESRDRGLVLAEANSLGRAVERRSALLASAAGQLGGPGLLQTPGAGATDQVALLEAEGFDELAWMTWPPAAGARVQPVDASLPAGWSEAPEAATVADRARNTGKTQFSLYREPGPGTDVLLIAAPTAAGPVLLGTLPLDQLGLTEAGHHLGTETGGDVFIFDSGSSPVFSHDMGMGIDPAAVHTALPASALNLAAPASATPSSATTYLRRSGGDLLLAYARIDPPGWLLVTAEGMSNMAGDFISTAEVLPLVLLFIAVLALLALSFGMAAIVRPLQELDRRAGRVAWGEFDAVDQPVGGVQEIDDLRETLAQMAARIRSYQAGMRDYLSATTQAQEEERARLAHELHDDTIQALIALKQRAQMARKALGQDDPERAAGRLDELTGLIDQELAGLRRLIGDLRPIYLEDLGFVPALEMLARQNEERHGLDVDVQVRGEPVRLAPDLELAAFRIVQAALANVVAHAEAHHVKLEAVFGADALELCVQDDGRGFTPPDQPADLAREGHFGLMGMRERAMLYGGHLNVTSAPGQGTTILAHLPVG